MSVAADSPEQEDALSPDPMVRHFARFDPGLRCTQRMPLEARALAGESRARPRLSEVARSAIEAPSAVAIAVRPSRPRGRSGNPRQRRHSSRLTNRKSRAGPTARPTSGGQASLDGPREADEDSDEPSAAPSCGVADRRSAAAERLGLRPHPLLAIFPPQTRIEFAALKRSVAAGQVDPVIVRDGVVLDGLERLAACAAVGVEPRIEQWNGSGSAEEFILARNAARRHLRAGQKAMVAARLVPYFKKDARSRQYQGTLLPAGSKAGTAAALAAARTGAKERTVFTALKVLREDPALAERVISGATSLDRAANQLNIARLSAELERVPPELPKGLFRTIVLDPPWPGPNLPYPAMTLEEIQALNVPAAPDCILWLWTTQSFLPEALKVLEAWDFPYRGLLTWRTLRPGGGFPLRVECEPAVIGIRGKPPLALREQTDFTEELAREHSRKPEAFYELVESLCPAPRLEMFARQRRPGWTSWGLEVDKFGTEGTSCP